MDKLEIEIPESLSDITLGQYQTWNKYYEANKDNVSKEVLDKRLLEVFCGLSRKEVDSIKHSEFDRILNMFLDVFNSKSEELIHTFTLKGATYGFEPNVDEMSIGVYTDTEAHLFEWDTCHIAMNALYRPISDVRVTKRFNQYQLCKYDPSAKCQDLMKEMPLDVVLSAKVFFYNLGNELLNHSLQYLHSLKKEGSDILQENSSVLDGDGINRFMHLQEEMLLELKKPLICQYLKR